MTVYGPYEVKHTWMGLSTDTKPTDINPGDEFFETDTKVWYLYSGSAWGIDATKAVGTNFTTSTDPGVSAAVTAATVNAYDGVVITTTAAGNAQTIANPTVTTLQKEFLVANNDTSTDSITVNSVVLSVGEAQKFFWEGSAWLTLDEMVAHAATHTSGADDIRDATNALKGLATAAQITALEANTAKETNVPVATDPIWTAAGELVIGTGSATAQKLAAGATTEVLIGGGAADPVWTTATGTGAPVRATSPTLVTPALGTPGSGILTSCTGLPAAGVVGTAAILGTNNFTGSQDFAYATVASHATTSAIWAAAGNIIDFTGTETITDFPAADQAGAQRVLICAGACVFTHAGNITVQGGETYTATANDEVTVTALSTTTFKLTVKPQTWVSLWNTVMSNKT